MSADTFRTIESSSEGLYKEKGSKFLSWVIPVKNEDEIKSILAELKKEHFSARHCCYAWSLGAEGLRVRMNDDGEPSGTAGRPIFGQIQSNRLTNVLIVVVRYFGGTLLGVGGLIQAYKQAAADAIAHAQIVERSVTYLIRVTFGYECMNALMKLVKEEELEMAETYFDLTSNVSLMVHSAKKQFVEEKLMKIEGLSILTIELI
ncbi:MAG: YigZ family protein [Marinilabiliales bacterium]|nr:YigZ family protein [Marinilabiliales bacterium]